MNPYIKNKLLEAVHVGPLLTMTLWNRLSIKTVKKIAVNLERKLYYHNEILLSQGEVSEKFYMLRDGRIRMIFDLPTRPRLLVGDIDQVETRKFKKFEWLNDKLEYYEADRPRSYHWLNLGLTMKQLPVPSNIKSEGQSLVCSIGIEKALELIQEEQ